MKVKSQDLVFGNFIWELGLIRSVLVQNDKVLLEALPMHLEGYGLEDSGIVDYDAEFEISNSRATINHCIKCFKQLNQSKGYVRESAAKLEKWIAGHKINKHTKSRKKMKHLTAGDLTKHGLVVKKDPSPIFKNTDTIAFIGKSYKYFSESTMMQFRESFKVGEGFDETIDVFNNDLNYVTLFAANSRDDVIASMSMLDDSILFVKEVYASILGITIDEVDFKEVRYEG